MGAISASGGPASILFEGLIVVWMALSSETESSPLLFIYLHIWVRITKIYLVAFHSDAEEKFLSSECDAGG